MSLEKITTTLHKGCSLVSPLYIHQTPFSVKFHNLNGITKLLMLNLFSSSLLSTICFKLDQPIVLRLLDPLVLFAASAPLIATLLDPSSLGFFLDKTLPGVTEL